MDLSTMSNLREHLLDRKMRKDELPIKLSLFPSEVDALNIEANAVPDKDKITIGEPDGETKVYFYEGCTGWINGIQFELIDIIK